MARMPRIIPVSDLRQRTSDVVRDVSSGNAVVVSQRGRAAAVLVSMKDYEQSRHELEILRLLAQGEKEISAGAGHELADVLKEAQRFLDSSRPCEDTLYPRRSSPVPCGARLYLSE